jgi:hypothetical protein
MSSYVDYPFGKHALEASEELVKQFNENRPMIRC